MDGMSDLESLKIDDEDNESISDDDCEFDNDSEL
jgi:hypothetical protein